MAEAVETTPEVVLSHLDSLPTLPAVALKLLQVTAMDDSSVGDVVRLLRSDQSLTAKVLSLAASAAVGARQPVTTLERAIPLLGFATIRNIVLATGVFDCFAQQPAHNGEHAFDRIEFWKHALAVACGARRLARTHPALGVNAEDAFVAGLLHDLGKVALDAVFPKAYDRIAAQTNHGRGDIADTERAILGADHTVAGRRLAERWKLPRELREVIWLHHLATDALPSTVSQPKMIGLVQLADTIAREQRIGYSGNHVFYEMSPILAERLGLSNDDISPVVDALGTDVAEHAALLGLDGETPQALYVKAMTRANAELGRLNADLAAGNQRLAAGARYFRAIIHFEQRLGDWADPAAVIVALAHAAAEALQRARLVAFGVRGDVSAVDISWVGESTEASGHRTETLCNDLRDWVYESSGGFDAVVIPAPAPIRALIGELLGATARSTPWLLPLWHDGVFAGGIVYM